MPISGRTPPSGQIETRADLDESDLVLESILNSEAFSKAYVLRRLLGYLWQHRHETLDEYSIAVNALGRKPDFDPKTDSAVRVNMARLRAKLKEFYDGEGRDCRLWLWLPRNGFNLEHRLTDAAKPGEILVRGPAKSSWRVLALAAACLVAGFLVAWLVASRRATPGPASVTAPVPAFWQAFFAGGNRGLLVLPDTTFLHWRNRMLTAGDTSVDAFSSWSSSPWLNELAGRVGKPDGSANYLAVHDALAAVQMVQHLGRFGAAVRVVPTRDLSVDSFLGTNVILLGLPETSYQLSSKMRRLDFQIDPGGASVRNLSPRPGEPGTYRESHQTPERILSHGVFALIPGRTPTTRTLILAASNPPSILPLLLSTGPLDIMQNQWVAAGSPTYYQGVVETVTEGGAVLRIRLLSVRPYVAN